METWLRNMGELVKTLRRLKGWSQRELARRAGVSGATVSKLEDNIETGNIMIETIQKIVNALGLSFEEAVKIAKDERNFANYILSPEILIQTSKSESKGKFTGNIEEKVGRILKKHREQKGLSLEQLSETTGMPTDLLANLELGKEELDLTVLKKVANVLNVTVDEVLEEAEKEEQNTTISSHEKDLKAFLDSVDGIMFYNGQPLNESDVSLIKDIVESIVRNKISTQSKK
jgi:transcriptional regulator with XRE-family HTH domain